MLAVIVYWNRVYTERAVQHLRSTRIPGAWRSAGPCLAAGLGSHQPEEDYLWEKSAQPPLDYWPLRLYDNILPSPADYVLASSRERHIGGKEFAVPPSRVTTAPRVVPVR
jgi:hypothetical protein